MLVRKLPLILLILTTGILTAEENFPQFRGEGGRGVVESAVVPADWSLRDYQDWEIEIPGSGWSQPIIWNQLVFVTAAVASKDIRPKSFGDSVRLPQSMGLGSSKAPDFEIDWMLYCVDAKTGKKRWQSRMGRSKPAFSVHPSNTYATETPAVDKNGVYVYFGGLGRITSFSFDGKRQWSKEVGAFKTGNSFGTGSSLAVHDGLLYLQNYNEENANLWCFHSQSGEVAWKNSRERSGTSWSTPVVWQNENRIEVISSGGIRTDSFDPLTGETLWTLRKAKTATACSMGSDRNKIYFGGSDPFSKGPLFAVTSGGSGDVSPKRTNKEFASCSWLIPASGPGMASPVSNGEHLYIVDKNILKCYDTTDGKRMYQNRISKMNMIVASPMVLGNHLLMIGEKGGVGIAGTGADFSYKEVGKLEDLVWSTPAATRNAVYIRGVKKLVRIGLTQAKKKVR